MTAINGGSPVRRETAALYRGRPLIVELYPRFVRVREKGRRRSVDVDYRAILELGWKMLYREQVALRKAAGAAARKAR